MVPVTLFNIFESQADGRQVKSTSRRGKTVFGVSVRGFSYRTSVKIRAAKVNIRF